MATKRITVVGVDRLRKKLAPKLADEAMAGLIRTASREAEDYAKARARGVQSVINGIHLEPHGLTADLKSMHPASLFIETGRRPGAPPPPSAALVGWMAERGITASPWVIARAISRRGIRGRFFMRGAKSRFRTRLRSYLKQAEADIQKAWKA
jgi:hypothetical protein